ncbi:MAG: VOC family protein [Candidatus Zixiibacteriota bacterium]
MPFKFSRCICLQTPDQEKAVEFYRKVFGLEIAALEGNGVEFKADPCRLFIDKGERLGPIMEFLVPNVEAAKEELLKEGCEIVRWEGKGCCCYMRDPFGFVFNLYEEPESFDG